jgi:large subunit ribosomal protein L14e
VDVIDQTHALVDGPTTHVARQSLSFRRLTLTDFKIKIPHSIRTGGLKRALAKQDVITQFRQSSWGQRLSERGAKRNQTDFDRFKLMIAKKRTRVVLSSRIQKSKKSPPQSS